MTNTARPTQRKCRCGCEVESCAECGGRLFAVPTQQPSVEEVTLCRWTWDGGTSGWFVSAKAREDIQPIVNDFCTMTPEFATAVIVETTR
jgi:hypothetical protein